MKSLLLITAAIEGATGLALMVLPSAVVTLLLGTLLDAAVPTTLARAAGAAMLALAVASWFARLEDGRSRAVRGLLAALALYNICAATVLLHAATVLDLHGLLLWPTVVLHSSMTVWCIVCLLSRSRGFAAAAGDGRVH